MRNVRRSRDYRKVNEFERVCPLAHLRWFPKNSSAEIYIFVYITNSRENAVFLICITAHLPANDNTTHSVPLWLLMPDTCAVTVYNLHNHREDDFHKVTQGRCRCRWVPATPGLRRAYKQTKINTSSSGNDNPLTPHQRSVSFHKSTTISSSFTHTDTAEARTYESANNIRITEIYRACSLRSRPCGGLCRNRSFVTHQVLGQEMHYRWDQTACLSELYPLPETGNGGEGSLR